MNEGRPARELSDGELEEQGTHAHATRNSVFLHGTAEQYQRHTERMLELEQEYLKRHPKRTWQGAGGDPATVDEATRLRLALRSLQRQVDAILAEGADERPEDEPDPEAVRRLVERLGACGGRMHKLELHQAARELGLSPVALAGLYPGRPRCCGRSATNGCWWTGPAHCDPGRVRGAREGVRRPQPAQSRTRTTTAAPLSPAAHPVNRPTPLPRACRAATSPTTQ